MYQGHYVLIHLHHCIPHTYLNEDPIDHPNNVRSAFHLVFERQKINEMDDHLWSARLGSCPDQAYCLVIGANWFAK